MDNQKRYDQHKALVDRLQREYDEEQGAYKQVLKQIEKQFGCDSLKAAEKELKKAKADYEAKDDALAEGLAAFEEAYAERLKELE